jgi:hypothetical protein
MLDVVNGKEAGTREHCSGFPKINRVGKENAAYREW